MLLTTFIGWNLNNRKSGANKFTPAVLSISKKLGTVHVLVLILILKYAVCGAMVKWIIRTQQGTFPSFLEIDKTAGAYSLQIYDYLSQIQRETYI